MAKKPDYEELERRVKELEQEALDYKRIEETLDVERKQLIAIFDSIDEPVYVSDPDTYEILYANHALMEMLGNVVGRKCYRALQNMDAPCAFCTNEHIFGEKLGQTYIWEFQNIANDRWYHCIDKAIRWPDGRTVRYEMAIDITEHKQAEEILREKQEALKSQARDLEEANAALKVLLRHREEDKAELEEKVVSNVKAMILPYIEVLKKSRLGTKEMAYVNIVESNLNEIVSPFLRKLSSKYFGLTAKQVQVAGLIKRGKTTKEIAELLNVSTRAVEFHRENIRAKLGLKNQPISLKSYLLFLE